MSALHGLWVIAIIILIIRSLAAKDDREAKKERDRFSPVALPNLKRLQRRAEIMTGSRMLQSYEFLLDSGPDNVGIGITFFMPRKPFAINIQFENSLPVKIESVKAYRSGKIEPLFYGIEYPSQKGQAWAKITILPGSEIDRLVLEADDKNAEFRYRVTILAKKENQPDFTVLSRAFVELKAANYESARDLFLEYEEDTSKNPTVSYNLALIYRHLKEYIKSEEYALKSITNGFINEGLDLYRTIRNEMDVFNSVEEVKSLKELASGWPPEPHYGVVVLEKNQRLKFGLGDYHMKYCSELLYIRRPTAARMFTKVHFNFNARKEIVLDSKMRVLNNDFDAEIVSNENLLFYDSSRRNIFITVEEEKECGWIVPDLAVGDIVEWNYSLLCKNNPDKTGIFFLTDINHPHFPTFKSSIVFETPPGFDLILSSKEGPLDNPENVIGDDGKIRYSLSDTNYVPAKNTGFYHENNYLNPVYACCSTRNTWESISEKLKNEVLGEHFQKDALPEPLDEIVHDKNGSGDILEQCFYWIRDKIKYASLLSGVQQIGKMGRARGIIEAGMGNCNDKSYLLCLVCKNLNIPFEIIAVSYGEGVIFKGLPADQFDHVFIRAKPADRWLYLDAASSYSVFGNSPMYLQGLDALFINEKSRLGNIAEDVPDSNRIEISEVIENFSNGWIETDLNIRSLGHLARGLDENLKSVSLSFEDQNQAAQEALRDYLPSVIVTKFEKTRNTANSNFCELSCQGKRCPVISFGDKSAANFRWGMPSLPMPFWRAFINEKLFVYSFPQTVNLTLTFKGDILDSLTDISNTARFSSDICDIDEIREKEPDYFRISRTINLREKYIRSDRMKYFPQIMDNIEQALQILAIFSR